MNKLFLDDVRKPYDGSWDVVRNFDEFKSYILTNGVSDIISFDHDLDVTHYVSTGYMGEKVAFDGYDCAKWLVNHADTNGLELPKHVVVHSWNPDGAFRIANLFKDNGVNTIIQAY